MLKRFIARHGLDNAGNSLVNIGVDNSELAMSAAHSLTLVTTGTTTATFPSGTITLLASGGPLGTPSSGTLTNCTGLNIISGTTGTLSVARGGTGSTTTSGARTNLGATTVGSNLFTLTNPSAVRFLRINADNTVTARSAAEFLADIGGGTGGGTVTSVSGTGTVSGLTLSGTVVTSGSLTLGGTLAVTPSNFSSQLAKTFLAAPNAAAGVPSFRTIVASDIPTLNQNTTGSAGSVANAVTFNNSGSGVASGTTYNGSTARTISYNTIGAAASSHTHSAADITSGTLAVARGGTGITSFGTGVAAALGQAVTGSGGMALAASPTFTGTINGADMILSGNLTVHGSQTVINSTTISVDDKNIEIGSVASPTDATADGGGITLKGTTDKTINWLAAVSAWVSSEHFWLAAGKRIALNGSTSGTIELAVPAAAGANTITFPARTGTVITSADSATVTNTMLAGSIANSKLANSTISGVALGGNLATLTIGTGLSGTSYNGSSGVTIAINSTVVTTTGTQTLTNKTLTSPTLTTPALGTPTSGVLSSCTGYPTSALTGLGTNVATFLATPSSTNLRSAVTDETGSGSLVFATSPTLVTPNLGTPSAGNLANCTGYPGGSLSGLGAGIATWLATPSSANLFTAMTTKTGTGGNLVFANFPYLTTPRLVTPMINGDMTLGPTSHTVTKKTTIRGVLTTASTYYDILTFSVDVLACKVFVVVTRAASKWMAELHITNDGTSAYLTEYGTIEYGNNRIDFDVDIVTGNVVLSARSAGASANYFGDVTLLVDEARPQI